MTPTDRDPISIPDNVLWDNERISRWVNGFSELQASQMADAMHKVRDDYEEELADCAARIAELEAQLAAALPTGEASWAPVPAGKYNDAWEILPDGAFSVRDHKGHWVVADWPDGWQLRRRNAGEATP